jgi:hypothetical protein
MNGAQEVPMHTTAASGTCNASVDPATGNVAFSGVFTGLGAPAISASLHGLAGPGATAPVLLSAASFSSAASGTFSGSGTLSTVDVSGMLNGQTYCEIDDGAFPSGEIRGQVAAPPPAPALPAAALPLLVFALGAAGILVTRRRDVKLSQ